MLTEKQIENQILDWFKWHNVLAWKNNSGDIYAYGRKIKLAPAGMPDISFILKGGIAGYVEVKKKGGRLSESQKNFINRLRELGCIVFVVYSLEELEEKLKPYIL